jgi:hypothetical protein
MEKSEEQSLALQTASTKSLSKPASVNKPETLQM